MATVREIISDAAKTIGALAAGETLPASEATDGLNILNRMVATFSNEQLIIYARTTDEFTLTGNQQSYTWGTSGDFNSARPLSVELALAKITGQNEEYPVKILTAQEWANITDKTTTSSLVSRVYIEFTNPTVTVKTWPIPNAANKLIFYSLKPLSSFSALGDSVSLPPGYDEMLVSNLALRLAPSYGKAASAELIEIARQSKANIKRINSKPELLTSDPVISGRRIYNIYTGE